MIWMWMSTIVVLFGAELNSEMSIRRPPIARPASKAVGKPRRKMADTLGVSR